MNFVFALIIYIGVLYTWGVEYLPTSEVKYGIVVGETGEKIGLKTGDKILTVDGKYVEDFMKIIPTIVLDNVKTIQVERDGQKTDIDISGSDLALLLKSKTVMNIRYPFAMEVEGYQKISPGKAAGIMANDRILGIGGQEFQFRDQFDKVLRENLGQTINLDILREGQKIVVPVTVDEKVGLGIRLKQNLDEYFTFKTIKYGFFESIPAGIAKGFQTIKDYLKQFRLFFKKETKAYESLGGFITIGSIFPGVWDWHSFWNMTAFISIILAIMNLLPIPALDGGHVMFLLYEMITGRKPGEKFLEYAQITGMVVLLALVLYANANDIIKLFR